MNFISKFAYKWKICIHKFPFIQGSENDLMIFFSCLLIILLKSWTISKSDFIFNWRLEIGNWWLLFCFVFYFRRIMRKLIWLFPLLNEFFKNLFGCNLFDRQSNNKQNLNNNNTHNIVNLNYSRIHWASFYF